MNLTHLRQRARGYLWPAFQSLGLRFGGLALQFLVSIYAARLLGASGYGVYVFAFTVASMTGAMLSFGLTQMAVREIATLVVQERWPEVRGWLQVHGAGVLASIGVAAVLLFALERTGYLVSPIGWVALTVAAACHATSLALSHTLNGLQRLQASQFFEMIARPLAFMALTWLALRSGVHASAGLVYWASVAALALTLPALALLARRELSAQMPRPAPAPVRTTRLWLREAFPFFLTTALGTMQANVALLILGYHSTSAEIGVFRAATRGIDLVIIATAITGAVLAPMLARSMGAGDRAQSQRLVTDSAVLACLLGWPVCFGLFFYGDLYLALFGDEFVGGASIMRVLALTQAAVLLAGPCNPILAMGGQQRLILRTVVASLTATGVVSLALVPEMGSTGAAWGIVAGATASTVMLLFYVLRQGAYDPTPFRILHRTGLLRRR